jgi:hypothetical protein
LTNSSVPLTVDWCSLAFSSNQTDSPCFRRVAVVEINHDRAEDIKTLNAPVLLVATVNAEAMRLAHTIGRQGSSELFILLTDPPHRFAEIIASLSLAPRSIRPPTDALDELPHSVRRTVVHALHSPVGWSVKRVAAEAGVSRRTLERLLARAHLPPPAFLLKHRTT